MPHRLRHSGRRVCWDRGEYVHIQTKNIDGRDERDRDNKKGGEAAYVKNDGCPNERTSMAMMNGIKKDRRGVISWRPELMGRMNGIGNIKRATAEYIKNDGFGDGAHASAHLQNHHPVYPEYQCSSSCENPCSPETMEHSPNHHPVYPEYQCSSLRENPGSTETMEHAPQTTIPSILNINVRHNIINRMYRPTLYILVLRVQ